MITFVVVDGIAVLCESLKDARRLQGDLKREGLRAFLKFA